MTIPLNRDVLARLSPKEALDELLKRVYDTQCELYNYGSGEIVLEYLQNYRLYTGAFAVFSSNDDDPRRPKDRLNVRPGKPGRIGQEIPLKYLKSYN